MIFPFLDQTRYTEGGYYNWSPGGIVQIIHLDAPTMLVHAKISAFFGFMLFVGCFSWTVANELENIDGNCNTIDYINWLSYE